MTYHLLDIENDNQIWKAQNPRSALHKLPQLPKEYDMGNQHLGKRKFRMKKYHREF